MDLSNYQEEYTLKFKLKRILWYIMNRTLFKILISSIFRKTRIRLLNLFGAKIDLSSLVYPSSIIWAPWNLEMGKYSCIGPSTNIYNKDKIIIGANSVISQGTFLCTASHDIESRSHSLVTSPIIIEDKVWIAADVFIGMGVSVREGAVAGARSVVFKNIEPWTVVGGNPAKVIKKRVIKL